MKKYINNLFSFIVIILFTVVLTLSILIWLPFKYYDYSDYIEQENIIKKTSVFPLFSFGKSSENDKQSINDLEHYKKLYESAINYITTEISPKPASVGKNIEYNANTYDAISEIEDKEISESDSDNIMKHKKPVNVQLLINQIRKKTNIKKEKFRKGKSKPVLSIVKPTINKSKELAELIENEDIRYHDDDIMVDELDVVMTYEQPEEIYDENRRKYINDILVVENETSYITIDPSDDDLSGSSFNSNPCYSEAARYISRCARFRRSKHN